jgi:hypothetical protein
VVVQAPRVVHYDRSFQVRLQNSDTIDSVALMRPASVTHNLDMNQLYVPLSFAQSGVLLTVDSPVDSNLAPFGYYMLFILNDSGVPSVAHWIGLPGNTTFVPASSSAGIVVLVLALLAGGVTLGIARRLP